MGTLDDYLKMLYDYKPKDKNIPVLSKFIQTRITDNKDAWLKDPDRELYNATYAYRSKARSIEKKKHHKHFKTTSDTDPLVQNYELLVDSMKIDNKIPLNVRTAILAEGIGIKKLAMPAPEVKPKQLERPVKPGKIEKPKGKPKRKRTKLERRRKAYKKFKRKQALHIK